MGKMIRLKAADRHEPDAYLAEPAGTPIGALVLLQEIFGINAHIRRVADGYAADGFTVIAPSLFDRTERNVELSYDGDGMKRAVELMQTLTPETALLDVVAAADQLKTYEKGIGVLGFCYGGFLSWITATRGEEHKFRPNCAVGYYPGGIGKVATEEPLCPVMLHFGKDDTHIGTDQIQDVHAAHPEVTIFEYPGAQHGFNCDARASYNPEQAKIARERTLSFLKAHTA
jgi:carboxymethylenebutenolidase